MKIAGGATNPPMNRGITCCQRESRRSGRRERRPRQSAMRFLVVSYGPRILAGWRIARNYTDDEAPWIPLSRLYHWGTCLESREHVGGDAQKETLSRSCVFVSDLTQ